jgi:Ni,Fe-hydrogenase I cytochrome b subunit
MLIVFLLLLLLIVFPFFFLFCGGVCSREFFQRLLPARGWRDADKKDFRFLEEFAERKRVFANERR